MKFTLAAVILSAITAATAAPAAEIDKRSCYTLWSYLECSISGVGGGTAVSGFTLGGGSSGTWCTSYCQSQGYTYAAIGNGSTCDCSNTISPSASPISAAGSCYSVCYGSGKTTQQCADGSCECGGPRAYSIYQGTQVC